MRIGIVTFIGYNNYGNRLQNYALQCLLEQYGAEVETILNDNYYDYHYIKGHYPERLIHMIKAVFWRIYDGIYHDEHAMGYMLKSDSLTKLRIKRNLEFSKKYIKESNFIIREGNFHRDAMQRYDYVVTGSDQVWNPTMAGASELFFLTFVPQCKRIAFSASIGLEHIPEKYLKQWKIYLSGMNYISVREESAKKIVEETSDKKAEVLLDPTMLVDDDIWINLMNDREGNLPSKYMLTYILGSIEESEQESIARISGSEKLELVELNNRKYEDLYSLDVIMFLKYIANAEVVITDSFHACVFSILFKREFYVFKRKGVYSNIYSRIDDLLKRFGLEERAISSLCGWKRYELSSAQKENIDLVLMKEREKADSFLRKILYQ